MRVSDVSAELEVVPPLARAETNEGRPRSTIDTRQSVTNHSLHWSSGEARAPLRPAAALSALLDLVRTRVPMLTTDRAVSPDIAAIRTLFDDGSLLAAVGRHLELQ